MDVVGRRRAKILRSRRSSIGLRGSGTDRRSRASASSQDSRGVAASHRNRCEAATSVNVQCFPTGTAGRPKLILWLDYAGKEAKSGRVSFDGKVALTTDNPPTIKRPGSRASCDGAAKPGLASNGVCAGADRRQRESGGSYEGSTLNRKSSFVLHQQ